MNNTNLKSTFMKRFIVILISVLITQQSFAVEKNSVAPAKSYALHGKILALNGKHPLAYANVALYSLPDSQLITGAISKEDGSFQITKVPKGNYYLLANFIGYYQKKLDSIQVTGKEVVHNLGAIYLKEAAANLEGVEISAEKDPVQYQIDKKVVNVSKKLDAQGGTVAQALENTPSVRVDMEGNVSLRGSNNYTVLIDGKPTVMSGSDALRQIPAAMVEQVEIITNPSAKYDPEGTAGIINILMKKNRGKSTNGIINVSAGTFDKYSANFSLNHFAKKVNLSLNGNYTHHRGYPITTFDSRMQYSDTVEEAHQRAERRSVFNPFSLGAGVDYNPNDNNSFLLKYSWGSWGFNMLLPAETHSVINGGVRETWSLGESHMNTRGYYHSVSSSYEHKFDKKGQKLLASFTASHWEGNSENDIYERFTGPDFMGTLSENQHIDDRSDRNNTLQYRVDYTLPFENKHKLELGYQGDFLMLFADYLYKEKDFTNDIWTTPLPEHHMKLTQEVDALYATYAGNIKKLRFLAGLRMERMDRNVAVANELNYGLEQINLFPSLHLTRSFEKGRQLQMSYSRRVNRPREWELYPFPMYSDSYFTQSGNPYLRPEFTDSYEINFMQRIKVGFVSIEAFYRQTNDAFTRVFSVDTTNGYMNFTTENMGHNYAMGAEVSANLNLKKWWNVFISANLYNYAVEGENVSTQGETQTINSDVVINSTFKIKKELRIQLVGFYNSPKVTGQGSQSSMYGATLSINKSFFNRKLTLTLSGRNIFNTFRFELNTETENLTSTFTQVREYPIIMLTASYKINDYRRNQKLNSQEQNFGGGML